MHNFPIIKEASTEQATPIGLFEGDQLLGLSHEDRVGNMYLLGRTGTGKSLTLKNMVISDVLKGRGGFMIDPYGDLAKDIVEYIPADQSQKVATFTVIDGSAEENLAKFRSDIHLSEMQKDKSKFLLCNLNYPTVGEDVARDIGRAIIKEFYSTVGTDGDLKDRTLYLDESHNFIDDEILENLLQSKKLGLTVVLSDQALATYKTSVVNKLLGGIDHLLCFNVGGITASLVTENLDLDITKEDIRALEQYHFYARLAQGGTPQSSVHLKGVFPLSFPKQS
jgi:hypothetical protein